VVDAAAPTEGVGRSQPPTAPSVTLRRAHPPGAAAGVTFPTSGGNAVTAPVLGGPSVTVGYAPDAFAAALAAFFVARTFCSESGSTTSATDR